MAKPLKLSDIKAGDKLIADEAFECIDPGRVCEVHSDEQHGLYVRCCGPENARTNYGDKHFLDGQTDHDGEIIGFARASADRAVS